MRDILPVVVDGLWRQGAKNLAVRLVSAEGQPLPAWTPGAHIDLHLPCGLIRQYSLTGSPASTVRWPNVTISSARTLIINGTSARVRCRLRLSR